MFAERGVRSNPGALSFARVAPQVRQTHAQLLQETTFLHARKRIIDLTARRFARAITATDETRPPALALAVRRIGASVFLQGGSMTSPDAHLFPVRTLGAAGKAIIQKWEGCARRLANGTFAAYPDPGSADGRPWTIGWGSTGPDVTESTIWTQAQCDARFDIDIRRYVQAVAQFIGANPTTCNQFDALVSFHYNTGAIRRSTLGRLHNQGRFARARAEFAKWIYNDGKPMNGLKARRADEANLYAAP